MPRTLVRETQIRKVEVFFSYTTGSPMVLEKVEAGDILERADLVIQTPFDGVGASLQLGTYGSPGLVLGVADSTPDKPGQYESLAIVTFPVNDFLILTIAPSGSTQGSGLLVYKFHR